MCIWVYSHSNSNCHDLNLLRETVVECDGADLLLHDIFIHDRPSSFLLDDVNRTVFRRITERPILFEAKAIDEASEFQY